MTETIHLGLPTIEACAGAEARHAQRGAGELDALVMLAVLDRDLTAPPTEPEEGDRYIVASPGEGAFAGRDDNVACFMDGGWSFFPPRTGWTCYVEDEGVLLVWDGESWQAVATGGEAGGGGSGSPDALQNLSLLGIGVEADETNPVSARLNNALWAARDVADGGDGDLRYKLSKEAAGNTLSLLFQSGFEGCAEIGLAGDDDFRFKVSPDGEDWIDALHFDRGSGASKINAGFFLTGALTPAILEADQNDYDPAGLAGAALLRLAGDAARELTGLSGGGTGRVVALLNVGSHALVLRNGHAGSSAANRFSLPADVTLGARAAAVLWYDATDERWRLLAGPQASGGGGGGAGRELLAASRTYYVRGDGSDANDGLSDTSGGAFLTIQKAVDTAAGLDLSVHDVAIQVAAGTYTAPVVLKSLVGAGLVTLRGDVSTPANVTLSVTGAPAILCDGIAGRWKVEGFKLVTATSGSAIQVSNAARLLIGAMDFGACAANHCFVTNGGALVAQAAYTISGNAGRHWNALQGTVDVAQLTITLTGTPAFASEFLLATRLSYCRVNEIAFSGSASGKRYTASANAVVFTGGGGATYLPGNASGTTETGAQYS